MRNEAKGQPSQEGAKIEAAAGVGAVSTPTLSLPKGGGAIRGIGEKFAANPVTGTGSMTVPIATSPGRSGFGPQLALSYDSGSGNGPFGFGWSLPLPSITRKTDKGLPLYRDQEESDVFILSGAEDLVPTLVDVGGNWRREQVPSRRVGGIEYQIMRYRPRTEGLFARVERWTDVATGETYWRSISRDNVTTLYGKDDNSRIFDSSDPDPRHPTRVFSWLISESYDDKGNAILYEYEEENTEGVDLSQAHERNRAPSSRSANRYLKRIKYGNRPSRLARPDDPPRLEWMFEVVFDYGEGHYEDLDLVRPPPDQHNFVRAAAVPASTWPVRQDPFSVYRAGFEVRTYRLCRRVLMFHHFAEELGIADCLVRSTDFTYAESPVASFMTGVTHSGYVHQSDAARPDRYLKKSLPPLEFEYSRVPTAEELARQPVREVDDESLENLPSGLDGLNYQWVDLDGEGLPGVLAEQPGAWYYKRNLSPLTEGDGDEAPAARFAPLERVATIPASATPGGGPQQFLDLAGDGRLDLVELDRPAPGFYERTDDADWVPFRPFAQLPGLDWNDRNLRFVDLTGDGHADVLITEDDVLTWYPSLAEEGFGAAHRVHQALDEEKGPRLVFADGTQSIYLADLSGDGLTDLVRIRNGEVCYWPNLGYGRFGAKVTMDNAPWFDAPDQFDQKRIRLADTDGSGVTDILYLRRDGVQLYFNQSGNRWSDAVALPQFPHIDDLASVQVLDLLGNGTACLVWSSPLAKDAARPMRYIDLMDVDGRGGQKPHLLIKSVNNLGAETRVHYAPSTKFYLADKYAGKPWLTRLPFPVHVVERVVTLDRISRNRFVTRYAYHHGYFDGEEREFRGFGMVEQWDTEELAALTAGGELSEPTNIDESSYVPPAHTKTWFHTGAWTEGERISLQFEGEYYREGDESDRLTGLTNGQLRAMLLPDSPSPTALRGSDGSSVEWNFTVEEIREAYRALKGSVLRREVYAHDGTPAEDRPYSVTEQNYTVALLQPRADQRHAVFFTHARESVDYHYERQLYEVGTRRVADPRVTHAVTLAVDAFGNVLKSVAIGYGRRFDALEDRELFTSTDRAKQRQTLVTLTENRFSDPVEEANDYRAPLPCEARTFEVLGLTADATVAGITNLFRFEELERKLVFPADRTRDLPYEDFTGRGAIPPGVYRRPIEHARTLYRSNDLTGLLPPGQIESLALPGESYQLAFTPGLLTAVFQRRLREGDPREDLLPDRVSVLAGAGPNRGGYVDLENNGHWWIPSGRVFYHEDAAGDAARELEEARQHFFLPRRFRDPFEKDTIVSYDARDLLLRETRDARGNTIQAENDYRVLQPWRVTDPNGNRSQVAFDALGTVAGTAVMGKATENFGDLLTDFVPDLTPAQLSVFFLDPRAQAADLLRNATTRIVYDLDRFRSSGQPPFAATLARETHVSDLPLGQQTRIQVSFSYSDGFGSEIQKKVQAEPGPVPRRDAGGGIIVDANGQPEMTADDVNPRWVCSGWTVFNNKGKPVRQYEPFFTDTHRFEFEVRIGVSPVLFYDPLERVVATLHPNHTWEKVVFDPWRHETWDVNDTVLQLDPKNDPDVGNFFRRLRDAEYLPTWYDLRTDPVKANERWPHIDPVTGRVNEENDLIRTAERDAATKVRDHANTPSIAHLDTLGRTFITIADNGSAGRYATRVELDIEGNQRAVIDARELRVMEQEFNLLGHVLHTRSVDAGERWMLNDVTGKPIRAWDSRGHTVHTGYDGLRRPTHLFVSKAGAGDPDDPGYAERLVERLVYGEDLTDADDARARNLRGRLYQHYDGAGVVTQERHDFKGNLLRASRRLARDYRETVDWLALAALTDQARLAEAAEPLLEPVARGQFSSLTAYDALNRPVLLVSPHNEVTRPNVIQHGYNEANLLERVDVWLQQPSAPARPLAPETADLHPVTDIDYDAKGQRTLIQYGNRTQTKYSYDPLTFRLTKLETTRPRRPDPSPVLLVESDRLQGLRYTYDPAGNITQIHDDALPVIVYNGEEVEPIWRYTYDALYRLTEARGREHAGRNDYHPQTPFPGGNYRDYPFLSGPSANDPRAMRNYREEYTYDRVGNILRLDHITSTGSWVRQYQYAADSNRLLHTSLPGDLDGGPYSARYEYNEHGSMKRMPHLPLMGWDFKDQLHVTEQQVVDGGRGERTYYVYDAAGERARKITESGGGAKIKERFYLGGFEVYREYQGGEIKLERETLHLTDDRRRIALVETKTIDHDAAPFLPTPVTRYQYDNHLGSACWELDVDANIITYEEYHPYGTTSYQTGRDAAEVSLKRCRYTGKERDEESALYYHGARNYAPWLGRWVNADPGGLIEGANLFAFCQNSPVLRREINGEQSIPATQFQAAVSHGLAIRREGRMALMDSIAPRFGIPSGGFRDRHAQLYTQTGTPPQRDVRLFWLFDHIRGAQGSSNAASNLNRAARYVPEIPSTLVLTIGAREHESGVATNSVRLENTYDQGGNDYLGINMHRLGLPHEVTATWRRAPARWNPEVVMNRNVSPSDPWHRFAIVHPAEIPARDHLLATAAIARQHWREFEGVVRRELGNERGNAVLGNLSPEARLIWMAYAYQAQGGTRRLQNQTERPVVARLGALITAARGSTTSIGVQTAFDYFRQRANEAGREVNLNDIVTDQNLNAVGYVRSARLRAAEATFVNELLRR